MIISAIFFDIKIRTIVTKKYDSNDIASRVLSVFINVKKNNNFYKINYVEISRQNKHFSRDFYFWKNYKICSHWWQQKFKFWIIIIWSSGMIFYHLSVNKQRKSISFYRYTVNLNLIDQTNQDVTNV
jgi:hypothetical protein